MMKSKYRQPTGVVMHDRPAVPRSTGLLLFVGQPKPCRMPPKHLPCENSLPEPNRH
jgi:hypothetical protein